MCVYIDWCQYIDIDSSTKQDILNDTFTAAEEEEAAGTRACGKRIQQGHTFPRTVSTRTTPIRTKSSSPTKAAATATATIPSNTNN
jgi:hypothetical protein